MKIIHLKGDPPPATPKPLTPEAQARLAASKARFDAAAESILARAAAHEARQKELVEGITDPVMREAVKEIRRNLI